MRAKLANRPDRCRICLEPCDGRLCWAHERQLQAYVRALPDASVDPIKEGIEHWIEARRAERAAAGKRV